MKKLLIAALLFATLLASGETPSNREIINVGPGQEFVISQFSPDPQKYPNDWYTLSDPSLSNSLVTYQGKEPEPGRVIFRFKAENAGETQINIYKQKGGKNSVNGLAHSVLVRIEK